MKKTCIFCSRRATTDEDVIPKWVLRILRKQAGERVPMRTYRQGKPPEDRIVADSAQKVGSVCHSCNNGWMSRLEEDVKPILTPMVLGNSVMLNAQQQERLTTWMTKCAMIYESMVSGKVFFDGLDRRHFMSSGTPFVSTSTWLGRYTGEGRIIVDYRLLPRQQNPGGSVLILVLTMVIGKLALQLTCAKWIEQVPQIDLTTVVLKNTKDLLVQVWPVNLMGAHWPPPHNFDDATNPIKYLIVRSGGKELARTP
jgi:hypothetical protein